MSHLELVHFTHKGVFGVCPVYVADPYNDDDPPMIERHPVLRPLMWLSGAAWIAAALVYSLRTGDEPDLNISIRITGKLPRSVVRWVQR